MKARWLASYPKSGNTWVRLFLACYHNGGTVNPNYLPAFVDTTDLRAYWYEQVLPFSATRVTKHQSILARNAVLLHCLQASMDPTFIKTHHQNNVLGGQRLIPTELTEDAIYIVRDPRDVALSMTAHCNEKVENVAHMMGDPDAHVTQEEVGYPGLFHYLGSWSTHVQSWMNADFPVHVMRYEDMVKDPVVTFGRLIAHLGWEFNDRLLQIAVQNTSFDMMQKVESEVGFRECRSHEEMFFRRGEVGGWQEHLDEALARKIEHDHGEVMEALGYLEAEEVEACN